MAVPVGELPTRDNCDLEDPEEMFLWMLVAIPGLNGAPFPFPMEYLRILSKRLYDCGARLTGEQTLWYHAPLSGDISPMFAAGEWKPEPPPEASKVDLKKLSKAMQDEIRRQALEFEGDPAPVSPAVQITDEPSWPESMRVSELAKHINATSKEVLGVAREMGIPVKGHSSKVPGFQCAAVRDQVRIKRALAYRVAP